MKYIFAKKFIILSMTIVALVGLFNGHYQATTIEIKGISGSKPAKKEIMRVIP